MLTSWFLYQMVAYSTMRTYGVNQAFRFIEGLCLHRKSRQIRFLGKDIIRAQHVLSHTILSAMAYIDTILPPLICAEQLVVTGLRYVLPSLVHCSKVQQYYSKLLHKQIQYIVHIVSYYIRWELPSVQGVVTHLIQKVTI